MKGGVVGDGNNTSERLFSSGKSKITTFKEPNVSTSKFTVFNKDYSEWKNRNFINISTEIIKE